MLVFFRRIASSLRLDAEMLAHESAEELAVSSRLAQVPRLEGAPRNASLALFVHSQLLGDRCLVVQLTEAVYAGVVVFCRSRS